MSAIAIGDPAPDFPLEGTEGDFVLSGHRGEIVVLLFYPGDETMVCTKQFCSYRDTGLEGLGATVVGISSQDLASHQRFTEHHGLTVPLLADADKAVAKSYGVAAPIVGTRRAVFVVDDQGVVRFKHVHMLGLDYLDADQLRDAVAQAGAASSASA
jgi:thioredoxin-dependent peroxiredoxin